MNQFKLILLDLDFTLLHSDRTISCYSLEVLRRFQEKGVLVGFSTNRGVTVIQEYIQQVNPDVVVCNGGAAIFYKNELIHTETFSGEESHKIFAAVYKYCGDQAEITCDTLDKLYWNRKDDKSDNYSTNSVYDDFKNFSEPVMKFCVQTTDEEKARLIASSVDCVDFLRFSDIPWYKFSSKKATKEQAVDFLSDYLKIPVTQMVAFGDDFSDMGMLQRCGTGVAMLNAIPAVKEIADDITLSCDEDGVARWLEAHE